MGHIPWYEVFDDALASQAVVAVDRVAEAALGRTPTRIELTSAHRAANGYAVASSAQTLHIWTRRGDGPQIRAYFLARADADLDDTDQLLAAAIGRASARHTPGGSPGNQSVKKVVASIVRNAHGSRQVDVNHLDPTDAQQLAEEIADALNDFRRFRDRLHQYGRRTDPEAGQSTV